MWSEKVTAHCWGAEILLLSRMHVDMVLHLEEQDLSWHQVLSDCVQHLKFQGQLANAQCVGVFICVFFCRTSRSERCFLNNYFAMSSNE